MIGEHHLAIALQREEIDSAYIDHSLTYRENVANLYKQFGVRTAQRDYARDYNRYAEQAPPAREVAKIIAREEPLVPVMLKPSLPFDPIERSRAVEAIVMRDTKRSYYRARFAPNFDCPVTVDSVGCCLSCAYCWNAARNQEMKLGKFYEPDEIAEKAIAIARKEKTWRFRVSGCEAILGKASTNHFCRFIEALQDAGKVEFVLLETNGVMLGYDESLVQSLVKFKNVLGVRVAIKGENPQQFERISGAKASSFEYQLKSLELLYKHDIPSRPAIMSTFMDVMAISKLTRIHHDDIDQERLKFYPLTKKSLIERGCWEMRKTKV